MDNVSGVAAAEVWHGYTDLLVVVVQVDANILLQFLPAPHGREHRVLVDNPAVEQAVFWDLLMGRDRAVLPSVLSFAVLGHLHSAPGGAAE